MEAKRIEANSPGTRFPRRLVRTGIAAVGLTLAVGGSAVLAPTISAQTTPSSGHNAVTIRSNRPSRDAETQELVAIAKKHRLGLGEVLAAELALQNARLGSAATGSRAPEVAGKLSVVAETQELVAVAQKHHLGLGEVLAAERALENARPGGIG